MSRCSAICWTAAARLLCPWDSPGRNTGVGCRFLCQGVCLTRGLKPHLLSLLHWQQVLYHLHHQGGQPQLPGTMQDGIPCPGRDGSNRGGFDQSGLGGIWNFVISSPAKTGFWNRGSVQDRNLGCWCQKKRGWVCGHYKHLMSPQRNSKMCEPHPSRC